MSDHTRESKALRKLPSCKLNGSWYWYLLTYTKSHPNSTYDITVMLLKMIPQKSAIVKINDLKYLEGHEVHCIAAQNNYLLI